MSTFVYPEFGKDVSEEYKKMEKVYNACEEANIEVPQVVKDYFEKIEEKDIDVSNGIMYEELDEKSYKIVNEDGRYFIIIDTKDIPKDVSKIRFVISS